MLWLVSHTCSAKANFELLELETALQTCAKLTFCLTQIYFLGITAWYRSVGTRSVGFAKICPNVRKGFRTTLIPQLLKTLLIGSAIPWMYNVRDYCKTFHRGISNHPLESCNQPRLDASNNDRENSLDNCFLSEHWSHPVCGKCLVQSSSSEDAGCLKIKTNMAELVRSGAPQVEKSIAVLPYQITFLHTLLTSILLN